MARHNVPKEEKMSKAEFFTLGSRKPTIVEPYFSVGKNLKKPRNISERKWNNLLDERFPLRKRLRSQKRRQNV